MKTGIRVSRFWIVAICIAIAFIAVRLIAIDRMVGTDDEAWMQASRRFLWHLTAGEFGSTHWWTHPGLPVLWSGLLGLLTLDPDFVTNVPNYQSLVMSDIIRRHYSNSPIDALVYARLYKLAFQAILLLVGLKYLRDLFGLRVMLLTGGLIAFEPFISGNDSLLVPDGFFATTCLVAVLSLTVALRSGTTGRKEWIVAGAFAGLAIITRWNGLVLLPVVGLCLFIPLMLHRDLSRKAIGSMTLKLTTWFLSSAITTYVLWPGLWVTPVATLSSIWDYAVFVGTTGHEKSVFYNGVTYPGDPGAWFYAEAIAWRLTPIVSVGIVCFLGVVIAELVRHRRSAVVKNLLPAFLFCVLFLIGMSLGAKKFDRYLIPLFPLFLLFAALGLDRTLTAIQRSLRKSQMAVSAIGVVVIVGAQAIATVQALPYRLDYYNPLMGGPDQAQHSMQMGYGEGTYDVLQYLESQLAPGASITIGVQIPDTFNYLSPDNILVSPEPFNRPKSWYENGYYVTSFQVWQRWPDPLFARVPMVHTVQVSGVDFFRIYRMGGLAYPPDLEMNTQCRVNYANGLMLMDVAEEGDQLAFYWLTRSPSIQDEYSIETKLDVPGMPTGASSFAAASTFVPDADGLITRVAIDIPGLATRESWRGPVAIDLKLRGSASGEPWPGTALIDGVESASVSLSSDCIRKPIL